ncbi:MAG: aldehyde dehydrogenase family protein [Ardenticatenaceae bacterium]|nr:aldehyde dehydrogenase family protein [Ardenticatenaceae bacterium]HBY92879.1 aldehyde dehydrogenase [Chloroflexota bacterium]
MQKFQMYVDGCWVDSDSGEVDEVRSPATGDPLGIVPQGTRADVNQAIAAARRAKPVMADIPIWERAARLHAVADAMLSRREQLARWISLEQGKPYRTEALVEVDKAAEMFRGAAEDIKRLETPVLPSADPNKRIITIRQPHGVYGVITPWNFPMSIPTEYLSAGLAGGNTIVWKPSSFTPICAIQLMECVEQAGFPAGALNVVTGPGSIVGDEIASNDGIDAIGLTGSFAIGDQVARKAGAKPVLLELGGNGPTIVLDDADLEYAIRRTAWGCFDNAGQKCSSVERILVQEKVYDRFVEGLVSEAKRVRLGHPLHEQTTMGPLNNEPGAAKVDEHLADARQKGADVLVGGSRSDGFPSALYYLPTVVTGVRPDMLLNMEETFGPVAPILVFADDDEAILLANKNSGGLISGVFTQSLARGTYYAEKLQTGIVNVNEVCASWQPHTPFGGYSGKKSGIGRLGGVYTILGMTQIKTMVFDVRLM